MLADTSTIYFTPVEIAVLAAFCAYVIWSARPELALGVYMSASLWARPVMLGPIAITWALLFTMVIATLIYFHRDRGRGLTPDSITRGNDPWIPQKNRWIIGLWLLWLVWMALVAYTHRVSLPGLFRNFLLYILVPMGMAGLIGDDMNRLRRFALAYVAMTVIACWKALEMLGLPLSYLLQDPGLSSTGVIRLGIQNYHFFSHMLGIALILAVTLFLRARNMLQSILLLGAAAIFAHFILLAGARQTMSGAVIILAMIVIWAVRQKGFVSARAALVLYVAMFVGISIYQVAPGLVVRDNESNVEESFNVFGDRGEYWIAAIETWQNSPIWGSGFYKSGYAHNVFFGALADQGLVGLLFFLGWLIFAAEQGRKILRGEGSPEGRIWRIGLFGIFTFGMIHGQASGGVLVTSHLYWSIMLLWMLNWRDSAEHPAFIENRVTPQAPALPLATRWIAPRRTP